MKLKALLRSQFVLSGLIYASGLAAFYAGDLFISRMGTDPEIAEWAALKSSLFIGASLCLLGLDQALVRNPLNAGRIARFLVAQAIVMAAALSVVYQSMGTFKNPYVDYFALLALVAVVLSAATYRSRFRMIESQLAANHWRLYFGAIVVACFLTDTTRHYAIILMCAVTLGLSTSYVIYRLRRPPVNQHAPDTETGLAGYYRIGARFCLSALFLNLSLYVEQLILKADGRVEEAATYFRYTTLFLLPAVAATGFLGFYLGPYIRLNTDKVRTFVINNGSMIAAFAACAALLGIVPGLIALPYISVNNIEVDTGLVSCLAGIAFCRILLVLPSAYLGVHASGAVLDRFLLCSAGGIGLLIAVYWVLSAMGVRNDLAVAVASLMNWGTRTSAGLWLTFLLIKRVPAGDRLYA